MSTGCGVNKTIFEIKKFMLKIKLSFWEVFQSSQEVIAGWKLDHGFLLGCHPPSFIVVKVRVRGPINSPPKRIYPTVVIWNNRMMSLECSLQK